MKILLSILFSIFLLSFNAEIHAAINLAGKWQGKGNVITTYAYEKNINLKDVVAQNINTWDVRVINESFFVVDNHWQLAKNQAYGDLDGSKPSPSSEGIDHLFGIMLNNNDIRLISRDDTVIYEGKLLDNNHIEFIRMEPGKPNAVLSKVVLTRQ